MRLAEGFKVDEKAVLGTLKFSALRRETFEQTPEGERTDTVKERTYDLKSKGQRMMIQVGVTGETPLREFDLDTEVELVNPEFGSFVTPTFRGADVEWYIKAEDIRAVKAGTSTAASQQEKKDTHGQGAPKNAGSDSK